MNLAVDAPLWLFALVAVALAAGAIEDALRLRISNITSLAVIAGAFTAAALHGLSPALWQNAAVFALILLLGTAAFSAGMLGGGDVKLFAAVGLWVDFSGAVWLVAAIFIAGGIVAVLYLLSRLVVHAESSKTRRIPYGIAIAAGAILVFAGQRGDLPGRAQHPPLPSIRSVPRNL